jgi:hypothetical protein
MLEESTAIGSIFSPKPLEPGPADPRGSPQTRPQYRCRLTSGSFRGSAGDCRSPENALSFQNHGATFRMFNYGGGNLRHTFSPRQVQSFFLSWLGTYVT